MVRAAEIAVIHRKGAENTDQAGQRKKKTIFCVFLCVPLRSLRLCGEGISQKPKIWNNHEKTGDPDANFDC